MRTKMTEEEMGRYGILKPTCNIETVLDGRGGIFTWVPRANIKEFNLIYSNPGSSRGDHYHPEFTEYFLVVEGSGMMVFKNSEGTRDIFHLSRGDCTYATPGIPHAFHAITPTIAVAMLSKPWDECNPAIVHEEVTRYLEKK